jgi:Cu-processing system ATP-binding protein
VARRALSFLPQKVAFPDALTGREVAEFYRRLRGVPAPRTDEVLRFACLNGAASRAVSTYSGGMIQRLGLAVAALPEAPVLLLDEPTAALDPEGLAAFYALAEERRREGRTILFTSHHLGDVERIADRFAVLVEGRLVALLSAAELAGRLADRGVLRLRLDRAPGDVLDALRPACPAASVVADELVLPGPASARPALLAAVGATGAVVLSLTADEGRLDILYSELVGCSR